MATGPERACQLPTPRLPPAPRTDVVEAMLNAGADPATVSQIGHSPQTFATWNTFYRELLFEGQLEIRTKEIARLRIAMLNNCHL